MILKKIDLDSWNRKQHFNHFNALADPYFSLTISVDVSKAYKKSKDTNSSFFAIYLHECMKTVNAVENFKYRIVDDEVFECDVIHASTTFLRADKTFGFSFINFSEDFKEFNNNIETINYVNNLSLIRYQMDSIFDNNINKDRPVRNIPVQKQYFGLKHGKT